MAEVSTPAEVFCCYSHADKTWLQKLEIHLSLLKRLGLISLWHGRLITPGTNWARTIDTHLETASVILLLVSADFLASDYCYSVEMQHALERQEAGKAQVIPILVRPVDWKDAPFAHLQALPTNAKPIASWRSKERALADIAAGIRRVIENMPLLAASSPRTALPSIWNIPYPRNPFFLGRDNELAQLRSHLHAGQTTALPQPQAISGLGGIGKSQLALEYAYQYHQDYQAVLWARAESTEALVSSYVALAILLRLPEREAKEQGLIIQAVKTWLQTHRDWLLILDNADELTLLLDFLPLCLGGHLLLTTRAAATGRLAHRLEIEALLPEHGALFLLRRAALIAPDATLEQASSQEQELAMQISLELGRLPLALDQAGAYIEETCCGLPNYQHLYRTRRTSLLNRRGGLVTDHPEPVATTWSLSFQRIEERNPTAADLLRLCAYLAPDAIPEEIITKGAEHLGSLLGSAAVNSITLDEALATVGTYSLLRRNPTIKMLSIHRLVQVVQQDTMEANARFLWAKRTILAVNATFPASGSPSTWALCRRLLPQAITCVDLISQYAFTFSEAADLLFKTARYLHDQGTYVLAEPLFQQALIINEQALGPEHYYTGTTLYGLARLYRVQKRYPEAEVCLQRALSIKKQSVGPTHRSTMIMYYNLARLYLDQKRYPEAEELLQHALMICEQQVELKHSLTGSLLQSLARLAHQQGDYVKSEVLFQHTLTLYEKILGTDDPAIGHVIQGLALLYQDQGRDVEAETLLRRALSIFETTLVDHPMTTSTIEQYAGLLRKMQRSTEATQMETRIHILRAKQPFSHDL